MFANAAKPQLPSPFVVIGSATFGGFAPLLGQPTNTAVGTFPGNGFTNEGSYSCTVSDTTAPGGITYNVVNAPGTPSTSFSIIATTANTHVFNYICVGY